MSEIQLISTIEWWYGFIGVISIFFMISLRWRRINYSNYNIRTNRFISPRELAFLILAFLFSVIVMTNGLGIVEFTYIIIPLLMYFAYKLDPDTFIKNMQSVFKYFFSFLYSAFVNATKGILEIMDYLIRSSIEAMKQVITR